MQSDLESLIKRVEEATGPDRELDVAILEQLAGYRNVGCEIAPIWHRGNDGYWTLYGDEKNRELPSPTASLDASLALVAEKLPGWDWSLHCDNGIAIAGIMPPSEDGCDTADCEAATPALALLLALLRALQSQGDK